MRLYLLISFWFGVAMTIVRCLQLALLDWPRERKPETFGVKVAETIMGIAFMFWVAILLWVL